MKYKWVIEVLLLGVFFFSGSIGFGTSEIIDLYWQGEKISDNVIWQVDGFYIPVESLKKMGYDVKLLSSGIELKATMSENDSFVELDDGRLFKGELEKGKPIGYGECINVDRSLYTGYFTNGYPNGDGQLILIDGTVYKGSFELSVLNGEGQIHYANGEKYEGGFWYGSKQGVGKQIYMNGTSYYGQWTKGLWDGYGKYIDEDGKTIYAFWEDGRMTGRRSKEEFNLYIDALEN